MDRKFHVLALHSLDQKTVGVNHNASVARLHRYNHLVELLLDANAQELHCRLDHSRRGVAQLIDDMLGQRAVVYAYAECNATLAALLDKSLQLATACAVVTRVYAHLVDRLSSDRCNLGYKVNVGNDSGRVALLAHLRYDVAQRLALALALRCKAHDGCSGIGYALDLCYACFHVGSRRVGHRLHRNRVVATNGCCSDFNLATLSSTVFAQIHTTNIIKTLVFLLSLRKR